MSSDSSRQSSQDEVNLTEIKIEPEFDSDDGSHDPLMVEQTSPLTDKDEELFDDVASIESSRDPLSPSERTKADQDGLPSGLQTSTKEKVPTLVGLLGSLPRRTTVVSKSLSSKGEDHKVIPTDTGDDEDRGPRKYTCLRCGYMTDLDNELKHHMTTLHPESMKDDTSKKTLKSAVVKPKKCGLCNMYFPTAEFLEKHTATHHTNPKVLKSRKCKLCNVIFPSADGLEKHMVTLHKKTTIEPVEKGDTKEPPPTKPLSKKELKRKRREELRGKKPLACDQCDFTTTMYPYLKKHKQIHSGRKPYTCDQCNYASIYSSTFKRHALSHGAKPYVCELCDYTASEEMCLKRHIERDHRERKTYSCDKCDYTSMYSSTFKRHALTHGGKLFICNLCDYTANEIIGIKRHKKLKHSGVEQCDSTTREDDEISMRVVKISVDLTADKPDRTPFITGDT